MGAGAGCQDDAIPTAAVIVRIQLCSQSFQRKYVLRSPSLLAIIHLYLFPLK